MEDASSRPHIDRWHAKRIIGAAAGRLPRAINGIVYLRAHHRYARFARALLLPRRHAVASHICCLVTRARPYTLTRNALITTTGTATTSRE